MKALGMIEVYSFSTALCAADTMAKAADVKVIAFDRNRPIRTDVPAPLVMEVKIEGATSAVEAAIAAGKAYAEKEGKYIVSHIIAQPDEQTEKMAYLLDLNKDKFNKKMKKGVSPTPDPNAKTGAIGFCEVEGLVASICGLDAMLKAAEVHVIHTEKRLGGRLVTFVVMGQISSVKAAVEAGCTEASKTGKIFGCDVIANPHEEVMKYFDTSIIDK